MHDIFCQFMVAARDKHLLPEQPVGAIASQARTGADIAQRRALARFGEGHGAAEATGQHGGQVTLTQFGAGKALEQIRGTDAEKGVGRRRDIGSVEIGHASA